MKKNIVLCFVLFFVSFSMFATTIRHRKFLCPVCKTENTFYVVSSYGSYIYSWPSRFEYIFWPLTENFSLYTCRQCSLSCFMWDFPNIPKEKIEEIRKQLEGVKIDWSKVERYEELPMDERFRVAEKVYSVLGKDDEFWGMFYRAMGYHCALMKKESDAANARKKALSIAEKMIAQKKNEGVRKELLLISGAMRHFLQDDAGAGNDFVNALKMEYKKSNLSEENERDCDFYLPDLLIEYLGKIHGIALLQAELKDEKGRIHPLIAKAWILLNPDDSAIHTILLKSLQDGCPEERATAARAIREEAASFIETMPFLIEALNDPNETVRQESAIALGRMGSAKNRFDETIPLFLGMVRDTSPNVRAVSLDALHNGTQAYSFETYKGTIHGSLHTIPTDIANDKIAIFAFLAALEDEQSQVRIHAIQALAKMAEEENEARIQMNLEELEEKKQRLSQLLKEKRARTDLFFPALIKALKDPDMEVREIACHALAYLKERADFAILDLLYAWSSPDQKVRESAIGAVNKIISDNTSDTDLAQILSAAIPLVQDKNEEVARRAITILDNLGEKAYPAVDILILALDSEKLKNNAVSTLGSIGPKAAPAIPKLAKMLDEKEWEMNTFNFCEAATALGKIGQEAIPALLEALKCSKVNVRGYALEALYNMKTQAISAIPTVEKISQEDSDERIRKYAAEVLVNIDPKRDNPYDVTRLEKIIERGSSEESALLLRKMAPQFSRHDLAEELSRIKQIIPLIIAALQNPRSDGTKEIIEILGEYGPGSAEAVPTLTNLLSDPNQNIRIAAMETLGKIGAASAPATPALAKIWKDYERHSKETEEYFFEPYAAFSALEKIGSSAAQAVPTLMEAVKSADEDVRQKAIYLLGHIGTASAQAVPCLILALQDPESSVQSSAICALPKIDPQSPDLVPAILRCLERNPNVFYEVVQALSLVGSTDDAVLPILLKGLQEERPNDLREVEKTLRINAVIALGKMGSKAIPALMELIRSSQKEWVVEALGEMGKEALPALVTIVKEENNLRYAAMKKIARLGKDAGPSLPFLIELVQEKNGLLRSIAAEATAGIGDKAMPAVLELLRSQNANIRYYGVNILDKLGTEATPHLLYAMNDTDWQVRCAASVALGQREESSVIPVLLAHVDDQDRRAGFCAELAILRIGPKAIPTLQTVLQDKEANIRSHSARLLEKLLRLAEKEKNSTKEN